MFRSLAEDVKKVINVSSGEVVRTCDGNELKEQASKDVQHWSEGSIHKGDDGASTGEVLLFLGQDVARRKLAAFPDGPRIGSAIFIEEVINQGGSDVLRCVGNGSKDLRVKEGFFNGLMV